MGRFFRDIWTEVIAAGVLAAMSSIIGFIQDTPPITIAIISFVVILVVFRISYYFQARKLKARMGIEKERWNRIREEKIKARQIYANRNELPKMLYELNQCNTEVIAKQKISKKKALPIAKAFFLRCINLRLIWAIFYFLFPFVMRRLSPQYAEKATIEYAITFNSVLKDFNLGSLSIMKDPVYLKQYNQIKEYEVGLPPKLVGQVTGYILLSSALNSLMLLQEDSPLWQHIRFVNRVKSYLPYMSLSIDSRMSKLSGDISKSIENFLTGE